MSSRTFETYIPDDAPIQSCYDYTYFEDIMNLFVQQRRRWFEEDPAIALPTVLRETDIDRYNYLWGKDLGLRVVRHFVGLGFLFYDPETDKLMARNKVMLDVFAMMTQEMQHRKDKIQQWENSCGTTVIGRQVAVGAGAQGTGGQSKSDAPLI